MSQTLQTKTFSPKELAEVIGVSQSSIKRWVDAGLIQVSRTAGGHRRIHLYEAVHFIRSQEMRVLRPDQLGLPDLTQVTAQARALPVTSADLLEGLQADQVSQVRGRIASAYLDGLSLAELFDGPLADLLTRYGKLWHDHEEGIYLEHRATAVCIEAIQQVRMLMPPPAEDAPVVLGGAPSNDPYLIPSLMAATVLADLGFRDINLGPDTPNAAFLHAVAAQRPAFVWLALTSGHGEAVQPAALQPLFDAFSAREIPVVLGGQMAKHYHAAWPQSAVVLDSMAALVGFAKPFLPQAAA